MSPAFSTWLWELLDSMAKHKRDFGRVLTMATDNCIAAVIAL